MSAAPYIMTVHMYIGAILRTKKLLLTSKWRLNYGGAIIRKLVYGTRIQCVHDVQCMSTSYPS